MKTALKLRAAFFLAVIAAPAQTLNYGRDVRPILSENCFHCHGQDSKKRMAGLRLDGPEAAAKKEAIRERITTSHPAKKMPPAWSNRTLSKEQVATLTRWIDDGARYEKHWAFIPPVRPAVPADGAANPIDAFVRQRLAQDGLKPAPEASRAAWLRRVSLDLTGLPPTPQELDSFEKDRSPNAYEKQVDRLLASPAYGERMAIDWLDVARYADTHGFNNDAERSMWRWRDWVIQSFNSNLPYDRFLTEQLAGDLLPKPTLDQRIATGFGRNHVINSEGGIIDEEYRVEYVADRVRTLGMAWLGLTVECARCHDHKFDPITQRDYYRFYAFFNSVPEIGEDGRVANAVPMIPAPTAEQHRELARLKNAIAAFGNKPIAGSAVAPKNAAGAQVCSEPICTVPTSKRTPLSISAWVTPAAGDTDAPLLSAIDYKDNPASTQYGKGTEVRLVDGEIEFRLSDRFPAYSVRVRSEGAALKANQRRHIAVLYTPGGPEAMRVEAAWVRIFADGRELPTRTINDGAMISAAKSDKVSPTKFKVGVDNQPKPSQYTGKIEGISFYNRALSLQEIAQVSGTPEEPQKLQLLRSQYLALRRSLPTVMVMEELPVPRETHVLLRGAYNAPGETVEPGVPEALLGSWPAGAPKNRLGLAQWLTDPNHPLTARVVVNRFWQQLFGQGLVKSSDNLGLQGDSPSHPELLDWLAREFIESGWNVKALLKQIVLSATYRQDSAATPELIAKDPENRLLARGPRFRLPAELIRDQALSVAGLLKPRIGGPSVFPYQKDDLYKGIVVAADYPGTKWIESKGDDLYRRSLYTFWKRTVPHPSMIVFDAPDREVCVVRRSATNTPLQALTLLNDPIYLEAARKLAERAIREGGSGSAQRLAFAFRLATGRLPEADELRVLQSKLNEMQASYGKDVKAAEALLTSGASPRDSSISAAELAAYAAVANLILNLDETITRG